MLKKIILANFIFLSYVVQLNASTIHIDVHGWRAWCRWHADNGECEFVEFLFGIMFGIVLEGQSQILCKPSCGVK